MTAGLFSSFDIEARRIRERVVASWPQSDIITPGTEQGTGVVKAVCEPGLTKAATVDDDDPFVPPVKVKVRLADAIKVGKEGYIHGFICVRPPCGKYSEATHVTSNGKVTHEGAKIGQQLKKEPGDAGYSIRHHAADGTKTTLKGQYATRHDAAGAVALYHNTSVMHAAANGQAKTHLLGAKSALEEGSHGRAIEALDRAHEAAAKDGYDNLAEHIHSTRVSLASHPRPVNDPGAHLPLPAAPEPLQVSSNAPHLQVGDKIPKSVLAHGSNFPLGAPLAEGTVTGTWDTKRGHGYTVEAPGYGSGKTQFSVFHHDLEAGGLGKPLKPPAPPEHPAEKLPAVAPAPKAPETPKAPTAKLGKKVTTYELKPGDRVVARDEPNRVRTVKTQHAGIVNFEDGGRFMPQGMGTTLHRAPEELKAPEAPAAASSLSPADEVKQLPHHQQEIYNLRTANGMSHEKALAYAKHVPAPGEASAGKDPYAGMSSHAKNIMMGIQGGKVSTGSAGSGLPPMKSKVGSVQEAREAAVRAAGALSHGVGDPEGQKVSKLTGEVRYGHMSSSNLVGHIAKVPGGHQAVSAKTGEFTGVHAKRKDALNELAAIHNRQIDKERAAAAGEPATASGSLAYHANQARIKQQQAEHAQRDTLTGAQKISYDAARKAGSSHSDAMAAARTAEQKAAPGSSAPKWQVSHHEEEYAGFPSGNIQDIHTTTHNGHQIIVDEPHYGDGWRFYIMDGSGNRTLSSSPEPNRGAWGGAKGYSSAEQAKAAAIQESDKLAAGGKPTWGF